MPGLGKAFVNKNLLISRRERLRKTFNKCVCSKYKTGIQHIFCVFLFPAADTQINSCRPDPTTTTFPSSSASSDLTASSASDLTETIPAVPTVTVTGAEQLLKKRFRVVCVTETIQPTEGPTTPVPEEHSPTDPARHTPQLAFKNDAVVFGGKALCGSYFMEI